MRLAGWTMLIVLAAAPAARADELARFTITEPLGTNWTDEWLTHEVTLDTRGRTVRTGALSLVAEHPVGKGGDTETVWPPCQFYGIADDWLLQPDQEVGSTGPLLVYFRDSFRPGETVTYRVTDDRPPEPPLRLTIETRGTVTSVANGRYELAFDMSDPLPVNAIRPPGRPTRNLTRFAWPEGIRPTGVTDTWLKRWPVHATLMRSFTFEDPDRKYTITFDFRVGDPWIGIVDTYSLGKGSAITVDLSRLDADVVYHPYAYNARTFKAGGPAEDSTLQPPQHPIATLGPIWRDIWFGGGPFAFIYKRPPVDVPEDASNRERKALLAEAEADPVYTGLGFAAVRGSKWDAPPGVSLESQNLEVHGHPEKPGRVRVRVPTDGGTRHWAIVVGPPAVRKRMGRLVRSHADTPLDKVLDEWVLDWESDAPEHRDTFAYQWLDYFNKHMLNPTTFPRRIKVPKGPVKGRDLAVVAYQFTNPDYWPGPTYKWQIGNPNFHTDMYRIPLQIGLAMPDHPHARRWVEFGIENAKGNIYDASYPGGAWAESLSYSGAFFHIVRNLRLLRDHKAARPFRDWPRVKEVATYLAAMHTPPDPRYGSRQKAPIGDTSPGNYVDRLQAMADDYRGVDDEFARQLATFPNGGPGALDISSRESYGFGAMLRGNAYDERHESFVTVKAGPARNHFQGDELAFYFASLSTPLAIDYACHYSPRPWHAAMHNRPDMNGKRPVAIAARRAFVTSDAADVFVADERATRTNHVPLLPHETTKPGWEYPWSRLPEEKAWTMRRYVMLVKHDPRRSKMADYLVVRDEIDSPEPVWWNLHVLAREIGEIVPDGRNGRPRERQVPRWFTFRGQLGVDLSATFLSPETETVERRQWGWRGDTNARRTLKGEAYEQACFGAWVPEDFEPGTWGGHDGEMAKWLRLRGPAGRSDWLVVLVPSRQGQAAPTVEPLSETSARVRLGDETEVVHLGSGGKHQAAVERDGETTVLLEAGQVKPWSELEFEPVPPDIDQGAL